MESLCSCRSVLILVFLLLTLNKQMLAGTHFQFIVSLNYIDHGQKIFVESYPYYCRPPGVATRYSISHSRLILLQLKQIHKINCVIVCRKSGTRESEKNEIGNCKIWPQLKLRLIQFIPPVSFYNPWKHKKTSGFLMFPGGIERHQ